MPENSIDQLLQLAGNFHQAGRLQDAERIYLQILQTEPRSAPALHGLSVVQFENGRGASALESMRRAAEADPTQPHYQYNLGIALKSAGRPAEAIGAFEAAIRLNPNFAQAHSDLGIALASVGRLEDAIGSFREAISVRPDFPEAWNNLGNALGDQRRTDEAVEALNKALALRPNYAEALSNLGNALTILGRWEEAIAACRKAVAIRPDMAAGWNNLGHALCGADQPDEAAAACRKALLLRPSFPLASNNLGNALKDLGDLRGAIQQYRAAVALRPDYRDADSNAILAMLYCEDYTAADVAAEMKGWEQRHAAAFASSIQPHGNDCSPDRRLRIGYVSADFFDHASAFFLNPLLSNHDHARFEIYCYADLFVDDSLTRRFEGYADHWRNTTRLGDEQLAEQIRADKIDILVDLKLHTAHNRLLTFARKPAPIQVSWLGYPGSSGLETIGSRLSDPYLEPSQPAEGAGVIALPDCFWCYDPLRDEPAVGELPALKNGCVTFGCLNNFCKVSNRTLELWAGAMSAVANSRLLLLAPSGGARRRVLEILGSRGVDSGRVEFVPRQRRAEYLSQYHRIDIGLDTLPYNGHTTSLDALWMGVPVITRVGTTSVGRAGWSQLNNLGLTELAAQQDEDFATIAAGLASDLPKLAELRAGLRRRLLQSPSNDGSRFARNFEAVYRKLWADWCADGRTGATRI